MAANDRDNQSSGRVTSLVNANNPYQLNYRFNQDAGIVRGTGADWFGPLNPIAPTAPEQVKGRILDFPSGYNLNIQPRGYEPVTFGQLRAFADSYDLLRLVIETRKDQIARLQWNVVVRDHAKKRAKDPELLDKIERIERFFVRPDGVHFWPDWIRMVMEDLLVLDAPAIFRRRTYGGDLYALEPIDGGTIKRVIDDWGRTPQFPSPAYQQVLKGFPAIDYTTNDLIYRPRNIRTHKIYGLSPVEQIIMTINIGIRRQVWQLQSFTEGNIPEALIGTPSTWTPDQIRSFQDWFDAMLEGNTGERRRARFVPGEVAKGYVPTKAGELFGQAEEWLARVVCYAFSVSPQPFIAMMNRATAETAQETAALEGLAPIQQWVKGLMDSIIIDDFGVEDLEFQWFDEEELDPNIKSQILDREVAAGLLTFNEARAEKGLDPFDHEDANRPMFKSATGYAPIFQTPEEEAEAEAMRAQISGEGGPDGTPPEGTPPGGGKPEGPVDAKEGDDNEGGAPVVASEENSNPAEKVAKADHADCPHCLAKREFDESAIERDERGRFSSGGGGDSGGDEKTEGSEGGGRYTQAELDAAMVNVDPTVAAAMTPEQVADLRALISDRADQETILAAMEPIYAAVPDLPPTMTEDMEKDPERAAAHFESRTYNVPEKDEDGKVIGTREVSAKEGTDWLVDHAKSFAGEGGVGYDREATIVLGPSAAGKSGFAEELAVTTNAAIVDSDEAKKIMPEYNGGIGAPVVHTESSLVNEAVEARLVKEGANIIIPKVGAGEASIAKTIDRLEKAGYKVNLVNVKVDKDEATRRMASRAIRTGRPIPADYVRAVGNNPTNTYNSLKGRVSGFAEIEASGKQGTAYVTETKNYRGLPDPSPRKADSVDSGPSFRKSLQPSSGGTGSGIPGSSGDGPAAEGHLRAVGDDDLVTYVAKSDAGELKKVYVNPDRKKAAKVQGRLKAQLTRYLRAIGKDVAAQVREKLSAMGKAEEPDFDVEAFIAGLDFSMFEEMEDDLGAALRGVYGDSGRIAVAQMGVRDRGQLVNQVNDRAVSWAKEHAADLVGRTKNPQYALTDSTRDMIRSTIATGMADNLSNLEIAEALEEAYAFSPERAEVIAMTEIASANSEGALAGYREAADIGVTVRKSWLMLEDACPICEENADNGIIELDEEFPSGDMTPPGHPNCRCVLVPEVEGGEGEEAEEIEGDEDAAEE